MCVFVWLSESVAPSVLMCVRICVSCGASCVSARVRMPGAAGEGTIDPRTDMRTRTACRLCLALAADQSKASDACIACH